MNSTPTDPNADPYVEWQRRRGLVKAPPADAAPGLKNSSPKVYLPLCAIESSEKHTDVEPLFPSLTYWPDRGLIREPKFWAAAATSFDAIANAKIASYVLGIDAPGRSLPTSETGGPRSPPPPIVGDTVLCVIDHGFGLAKFHSTNAHRHIELWDQSSTFSAGVNHSYSLSSQVKTSLDLGRLISLPNNTGEAVTGNDATGAAVTSDTPDESAWHRNVDYLSAPREWTHGALVADVAAGRLDPLSLSAGDEPLPSLVNVDQDVASTCAVIFIQLPRTTISDSTGMAMAPYVIAGLHYAAQRVQKSARLVVNLSFGTFAGPHDGSSFLERAVDDFCESRPNTYVTLPAGNSFGEACHAVLPLKPSEAAKSVDFLLLPDNERDVFIELWWSGDDNVVVSLAPPDGSPSITLCGTTILQEGYGGSTLVPGVQMFRQSKATRSASAVDNHFVLIAFGPTMPGNPKVAAPPYGRWQLTVKKIPAGSDWQPIAVHAYIERGDQIAELTPASSQARFVTDRDEWQRQAVAPDSTVVKCGTLNAYATGERPIVVGARYRDAADGLSPYTSSGPGRNGARSFGPDVVAIGDDSPVLPGVLAAKPFGTGVVRLNGTSVAAPQIARKILNGGYPFAAQGAAVDQPSDIAWGLPEVSTYRRGSRYL